MEESKISCAYYPTTVVVVDDSLSYLKNLQYTIGKDVLCECYSVPEEALDFINQVNNKNNLLKDIVGIDADSEHYYHLSTHMPLQYDIPKISQHIYQPDRFAEVAVVVVDYAMPGMDGEEFCKRLRKLKVGPVKIIMLTGEADDPQAIKLFNAGFIDRFLRKAQPGLDDDLKNAIIQMQKIYFRELTYPLVQGIASDEDSALGDPAFIELFNNIYQEMNASSYYLIESSGSFIFIDNAGKPSFLIIKTLNELAGIAEEMSNENLSEEIIDSVKNGDYVPYFGDGKRDFYSAESTFKEHLYPAKKLIGNKEYAYAVVKELPWFSFDGKKVISFDDYHYNH